MTQTLKNTLNGLDSIIPSQIPIYDIYLFHQNPQISLKFFKVAWL